MHHSSILFLLTSFLITTLTSPQPSNEPCNTYTDCFNCSISHPFLCIWNDHSCDSNNNQQHQPASPVDPASTTTYINTFTSCEDFFTLNSVTTLCGKSNILLSRDTSFELSLPSNDGYYGTTNTFCKYSISFKNIHANDKVDFTLNINEIENKPSILYLKTEVTYLQKNTVHIKEFKDNTKYKKQYEEIDTMVVYFYSPITLNENPFTISFKINTNDSKIVIFIIVGVVTAVCLICVISIYCFTKKLLKKKIEGNNDDNNAQDDMNDIPGVVLSNRHSHHHHHHHHHHSEKRIDTLFTTSLTELQYNSEVSSYGTNCTICLDNFTIGKCKVILTPCKHVFHKKCLSNWLHKNKAHPICPNCNLNFIDYEKQISKETHHNNNNNRDSDVNTIIIHKKEDNKETTNQQGLVINNSNSTLSRNYSTNANPRQILYLRHDNNSERFHLQNERSSMSDFENVMS